MSAGAKRLWWIVLALTLLFGVLLAVWLRLYQPKLHFQSPASPSDYQVTHFVDGDTLVVSMAGQKQTIRLIGVDTPETHDPRKPVQCYGQVAANFTKQFVGSQSVRLMADPLSTNRDRYNRLLRYVYLPNNQLLNEELIKRGYGFAYLGFPFSKSAQFAADQHSAQASKKGLWGICHPVVNKYGGYSSNPL